MKKLFSFALIFCFAFSEANAQAFQMDKIIWTTGYGIGPIYEEMGSNLQDHNFVSNLHIQSFGTFYAKIEYGVNEKAGIGINLSYVQRTYTYNFKTNASSNDIYWAEDKYSSFGFMMRMNRHGTKNTKVDVFIGLGFGYAPDYYKRTSNSPNGNLQMGRQANNFIAFDASFGGRYYFSPAFGFYIEAGFGETVMQAGLTGKF
jgi:hypothetical protein